MPIVALGLLGIDPIGALLIISALMAGARRYRVLIFTATFIGGTVLLGTVLSLLGQGAIDYLQSFIPHSTSPLWAILSLAVIVAIIAWLTVRYMRRHSPAKKKVHKKPLLDSTWQFTVTGLVFALSALTDPTFYAVIVLAAETHNPIVMAGLHFTWISISQIPLLAVVAAYLFNIHKPFIKATKKLWKKHKNTLWLILYAAAITLAVALLVDIGAFIATGNYLF